MIQSYSGNSAYCFSNSLRMCLAESGADDLPEVSFIECLTGMPFGTTFLALDTPLFFPNPAAIDPNIAIDQALTALGWSCKLWQGEAADDGEAALRDATRHGPVLLGPVDMGFLSYDPQHAHKRGGDHFVVVLELEGDSVRLHDPQLYPYAILSLSDLVRAWNARHLGYMRAAYTLRHSFRRQNARTRRQLLEAGAAAARDLQTRPFGGPVAYSGQAAFTRATEVLGGGPPPPFATLLTNFALPLGARRCLDGATFMHEAGNTALAALLVQKAKCYGSAQYHASKGDWRTAMRRFTELGELESQLTQR